eukprot:scaffold3420_cov115-Isochrysis_galbana.AAC.2
MHAPYTHPPICCGLPETHAHPRTPPLFPTTNHLRLQQRALRRPMCGLPNLEHRAQHGGLSGAAAALRNDRRSRAR